MVVIVHIVAVNELVCEGVGLGVELLLEVVLGVVENLLRGSGILGVEFLGKFVLED